MAVEEISASMHRSWGKVGRKSRGEPVAVRVTFSAFGDIDALDRRDDAEGKGRGRCPTRSAHRGHRAYQSTRASERVQAKPSWKILGCDAARRAPSEGLTNSQIAGASDRHGCLFHPCAMWSPMHASC